MQETDFLGNTNFLELAEIHRQHNGSKNLELVPSRYTEARSLFMEMGASGYVEITDERMKGRA